MAEAQGGDVFLLLPRVLLEGGASVDGCEVVCFDLPAVEHVVGRVRALEGEESCRTM